MALWRAPFADWRELDDDARALAPGQFVRLSEGLVHYRVVGPERGAPLVLIHGIAAWQFAWDPILPELTAAGHRVLLFDLYGRGYSDRPHGKYDLGRYVGQTLELMDAVGFSRADVVGWSMGGAVALGVADRARARVARLGLMAPAGLVKRPAALALLRVPGLGKAVFRVLDRAILDRALALNFHDPAQLEAFRSQILVGASFKGFRRAVLSSLCDFPLDGLGELYASVGQHDRRVLLVWGNRDLICPYVLHERALAALPRAEFEPIEDVGHALHWETPGPVARRLIGFLARADGEA